MTATDIRRLLLWMVQQIGSAQRVGIGVRHVDPTDPAPYVAALDRGFRVSDRRRREFLAGRAAAADALAHLGMPRRNVSRTDRGVPVWPTGLVGSISHSRNWAVAIILDSAVTACCGLDIEELPPSGQNLPLELHCAREALYKALSPGTGRCFHPQEWQAERIGPDRKWTPSIPKLFEANQARLGGGTPRLATASIPSLQVALVLAHRAP
ncbi:hypothetical protein [Streptomyces sp. NPDC056132]|uniref:hypothetical protein n=1 Tax=Streptomyces sp. NPDC056132 TaxID=3345722 RepID=UPI0035D74AA7